MADRSGLPLNMPLGQTIGTGTVTGVTAGNTTVTIGGTAAAPTVAVNLGNVNTWTVPQAPGSSNLTSGAAADFTTKQKWVATVNGGTFTITNPSAATTDAFYEVRISYTTSNSVAWGTNFKGISAVTWTATAGAVDIALFQYTGSVFELVGYSLNAGA